MTNFLHWRKTTWALVLWSGLMATWIVVAVSGRAIVALLWLAGMIVLGLFWLATQPLFRRGRGLRGFFVRPGWGQWRVVNLHRTQWGTEPRRDAG